MTVNTIHHTNRCIFILLFLLNILLLSIGGETLASADEVIFSEQLAITSYLPAGKKKISPEEVQYSFRVKLTIVGIVGLFDRCGY